MQRHQANVRGALKRVENDLWLFGNRKGRSLTLGLVQRRCAENSVRIRMGPEIYCPLVKVLEKGGQSRGAVSRSAKRRSP